MDKRLAEILVYLPEHIKLMLFRTFQILWDSVQEIRFRASLPLIIGTENGNFFVLPDGEISRDIKNAYITKPQDIERIFRAVCENSVYAFSEEIRQGFVTIRGGHRVGISGRAVANGKIIETFRDISSLNIRVAREVIGSANGIVDYVLTPDGLKNTLIAAPPMGGKTTVLRDLSRQISNRGIKTAIADERGEIAALFKGVPQNDVGIETDVLENVPKAEAAIMLLRTMSPSLIITDEISSKKDAEAILECFGMGVGVVATTHGDNADEILSRTHLRPLLGVIGFRQLIVLKKKKIGQKTKVFGEVRVVS